VRERRLLNGHEFFEHGDGRADLIERLALTAALINEADDWEIEQPLPVIFMFFKTPSSTSRYTTISSPHRGLKPSTRIAGGDSSSPRLRGER